MMYAVRVIGQRLFLVFGFVEVAEKYRGNCI